MRVGTVCYATATGLGIECKAFFDHGLIQEIFVVQHSRYKTEDWYPDACSSVDELLDKVDKLIFFETAFDWQIIRKARERGIETILVTHYECTPNPPYYWPDKLIAPSDLDYEIYKDVGLPLARINIPVETPWNERTVAKTFICNGGHGGIGGRNGISELLDAMKYVTSPIKLIVRAQNGGLVSDDPRVEIVNHSVPYEDLWKEGDVLILPEKFGGSFLPMQEAFASGLAVMASDRKPTNQWLPKELLIPVSGYTKKKVGMEFDCAIVDPKAIAAKIDEWYGKDISAISKQGKQWAQLNSWKVLKPRYEAFLCED